MRPSVLIAAAAGCLMLTPAAAPAAAAAPPAPTAAAAAKGCSMTAVRTLANVRVRTAPSTRARIQKVVPANHWVAQAGRDAAAESRGWWRVSIDGGKTSGWMHADYVDPLWIHQTQCGTLPTPWPVPAEHLARYRAASGR